MEAGTRQQELAHRQPAQRPRHSGSLAASCALVALSLGARPALGAPTLADPTSVTATSPVDTTPSASTTPPSSGAPGAEPQKPASAGSCSERIPEGKTRPTLEEVFPSRGLSGHALWLELTLSHGPGETVLPGGFSLQQDSPEYQSLTRAGFTLPQASSLVAPELKQESSPGGSKTRVRLPFLALPAEPGSTSLTLPALPIAIARASGEIMSVCTSPHAISIDDPTTNTANPEPQINTPPRRQEEPWTAAKNATYGALAALVIGALLAWAIRAWSKRERPKPAPPPPRPAWELALEQLALIKHAQLVSQGQYAEHYARVAHVVREYLGARYGFDGLECTTAELTRALDRITPAVPVRGSIDRFLWRADLVKFARLTPAEEECSQALDSAEQIVEATRTDGAASADAKARADEPATPTNSERLP